MTGTANPTIPTRTGTSAVVQSKAARQTAIRDHSVEDFNIAPASSGRPLPNEVREKMEALLGMDLSDVRIHEGPQAERMGARAFTLGTNVFFAPGQYQPWTPEGQALLAHELTHVVQQAQGRVTPTEEAEGVAINDDANLLGPAIWVKHMRNIL